MTSASPPHHAEHTAGCLQGSEAISSLRKENVARSYTNAMSRLFTTQHSSALSVLAGVI